MIKAKDLKVGQIIKVEQWKNSTGLKYIDDLLEVVSIDLPLVLLKVVVDNYKLKDENIITILNTNHVYLFKPSDKFIDGCIKAFQTVQISLQDCKKDITITEEFIKKLQTGVEKRELIRIMLIWKS